MAITTLSGAAIGMQYPYDISKFTGAATPGAVRYTSLVYNAGFPAAFTAPSPGMTGAALTSYDGQIPFTNPASGNTYLGSINGAAFFGGCAILVDRLWHNSGIDVTNTGAQTVNSVAWPSRDQLGGTAGVGVIIGLEVSATCGAAVPTITLTYTNSAGTGARTATTISAVISGASVGHFYPFGWQDGDIGVRSIQSIQLGTSWLSGTVHLVAYTVKTKWLLDLRGKCTDWYTSGAPRFYNNSVPTLLISASSASATSFVGNIQYTQG